MKQLPDLQPGDVVTSKKDGRRLGNSLQEAIIQGHKSSRHRRVTSANRVVIPDEAGLDLELE